MGRQGGGDGQPFGPGGMGLALGLLTNAAGLALGAANRQGAGNPGELLLWVVFAAYLVVGCLILALRDFHPGTGQHGGVKTDLTFFN